MFGDSHSFTLGANPVQQSTAPATVSKPEVQAAFAQASRVREQGNVVSAITAYSRAVELAKRSHDTVAQVRGLIVLGILQISNFQYRSGLQAQSEAERLATDLHDARLAGAAAGNLATLYSQVGDWPSAEAESARAIEFFRKIPNPTPHLSRSLAQALQSHAYLCFYLGRNAEGYGQSAEALMLAESARDLSLQALIWDMRGAALTRENKLAEAESSLQNSLRLSEELKDKDGLAFVQEHLAELELEKNRPDWNLALKLINQAADEHSGLYKSYPKYIPLHIRGKILLGLGNKSAALSELMHAVTAANEWRLAALPGDGTKTFTVAALQDVYADYAHLAADIALQTGTMSLSRNALEVLAQNRAAGLRDQLRSAYEMNGRLPDEYFFKLSQLQSAQAAATLGTGNGGEKEQLNRIRLEVRRLENQIGIKPEKSLTLHERNQRRNSLRDIQHTLDRYQVLISISLGKKQSFLWAVTGDQVHLSRLPAESEIQSKADGLKAKVRTGQDSRTLAADLSHALFAGLPPDIWRRSEWLMVADGPLLDGIPFCTLPNPEGQPFIQGRSLRFLPSELLLLDGRKTALAKKFVGVGDPIYNLADGRLSRLVDADIKTTVSSGHLARLAGSETEIESAAQESSRPEQVLLSGRNATRKNLDVALSDVGILHFAVHVISPIGQPEQAALALTLKNGFPELLTPEVIAAFHVPGSLVVLSGCSSGQGKILPGSGLVGLSRAWLLAGSSAVIVSSWPTADDSGLFFTSFYKNFNHLPSGNTAQRAALALSRTQLDMLHGSTYQKAPSFWGAFAVISKE